ncbi:C-C motif chemokine 19b [Alosa pseudoharengus]|uniref:C-C motif chemokine 19b n=1 Tax=Alosa pseudoharengus TaxID=34774 RepID=UPI003F88BAC9
MMLLRVTTLLLLAGGLWDAATAATGSDGAIDCCLTTSSAHIPRNIVKSYEVQTTDGGCKVDATLFTTKRNKKLCAPPASREKWVRDILKHLNKKSSPRVGKGCRKGKNQKRGRRCRNRQ